MIYFYLNHTNFLHFFTRIRKTVIFELIRKGRNSQGKYLLEGSSASLLILNACPIDNFDQMSEKHDF